MTQTEHQNDQKTIRQAGVLGLGCWAYGGSGWGGQDDAESLAAMSAAWDGGVRHIDTAAAYGGGRSEKVVGQFLAEGNRAAEVYLATKANKATPEALIASLNESMANLGVECVDLFYIHWPHTGKDVRPLMEALEKQRQAGRLRHIGVSNFQVEHMEQASQVGRIDAHQFCYNLLWRFAEDDILPYCHENDIACVTYGSIAMGILTGKFGLNPEFPEGDVRSSVVFFDDDVWPKIHAGVERLKALADRAGQPLLNLAIQWVARQDGVSTILVGARNADQARQNAAAMATPVDGEILDEMTAISDELRTIMPDVGNIFRYYP
jgi:aryl-alcohol dehydrogenase-like predicted oxidoreductase